MLRAVALPGYPAPHEETSMKINRSRLAAFFAGIALVLCADLGLAQGDVQQRASQMKLYAFGDLSTSRYDVVARLWADSWRSAFWVQTFPTEEQAIAALQTEAASRGADALLNVSCLDQGPSQVVLERRNPRSCATGSRSASGRVRGIRATRCVVPVTPAVPFSPQPLPLRGRPIHHCLCSRGPDARIGRQSVRPVIVTTRRHRGGSWSSARSVPRP